ncbi:hypothetical protein [Maribacter sp. 2308TA10-17]|uniref:hypothetical protein n=1 Tax=Maribacter sp. 2308TA10-17 TaxID=3386276 RepID=UPI0039BC2DF6
MKKNTKTYILLGAVVLIWGVIGYRIFSSITSEPERNTETGAIDFKPQPVQEKEKFSIVADYRDPFLGTLPKKAKKKVKRSALKTPLPPEIAVTYTGFVSDKDTKENIYFVTINGRQHIMSVGNEIEKVKLVRGNATSIKIRANKKTRTITLQK